MPKNLTNEEELQNGEQNNESSPVQMGNETDYISAITDLKNNTVSKDEYRKLQDENRKLINALSNGESLPAGKEVTKPDINALREALTKEDQTNLEFVQNVLNLRNALIEAGEEDPFVPNGHQIQPTDEDRIKAQNVADVFQDCIDYAEGDSAVFTNELMRRTNDVRIFKKSK